MRIVVSPKALAAYEALRTAVIDGRPRPEGTAALRYHGMLQGLSLLRETPTPRAFSPHPPEPVARALPLDDEFVRLLANLVLRTHSEVAHVY